MSRSVQVILNPTSGGGRGLGLRDAIARGLKRRGVDADIRLTGSRRHATELAQAAAAAGVDAVVAAGGDGTVHEVANGLLAARRPDGGGPALGVVPIGTGNDFVKMLGHPKDRERALDVVAGGRRRAFDVGRARWDGGAEYFVNGAGTGVDVEVVRQALRIRRLSGFPRYLAAVVRALIGFEAVPLRVTVDGDVVAQRMMIVAVANGPCIGGGFQVAPGAVPDDGRFDVCITRELSWLGIARVLPRVIRGTHTQLPQVTMLGGRTVTIEALGEEPLFFQLDGELHEPPAARRLELRVEPGALPVLAPLEDA